jgi:hypothetical protein
VSEAKRQSPDAAMRARERDGLFDMVKNAVSDGRPHPEERACDKGCANANLRARVSKDEDEQVGCALMLRDASQRASATAVPALASRCDAPQHEGEKAPRILAKRTQLRFWPNEPKSRLSTRAARASAGTTSVGSGAPTFGCRK